MPEPIVRPSVQMPAKSTHPAIVLLRLSMLAAPFAGARSSERLIDLALPYWGTRGGARDERPIGAVAPEARPRYAPRRLLRSVEHTSDLQSLLRTSYAVFCLK